MVAQQTYMLWGRWKVNGCHGDTWSRWGLGLSFWEEVNTHQITCCLHWTADTDHTHWIMIQCVWALGTQLKLCSHIQYLRWQVASPPLAVGWPPVALTASSWPSSTCTSAETALGQSAQTSPPMQGMRINYRGHTLYSYSTGASPNFIIGQLVLLWLRHHCFQPPRILCTSCFHISQWACNCKHCLKN